MFRMTIPAALAAILLSTAALASPSDKVMGINVDADLLAVADPQAGSRFPQLEEDITGAITGRLADRLDAKGIKIDVDITEIALQDNFPPTLGRLGTKLAGKVHFTDNFDNTNTRAFGLTVSLDRVLPYVPPGYTVDMRPVSPDAVYRSLVTGFADALIAQLNL